MFGAWIFSNKSLVEKDATDRQSQIGLIENRFNALMRLLSQRSENDYL